MLKMEWRRGVNYLTGLWLGFKKSFLDIAEPTVPATQFFHTGVQYFITPDLQFDIHSEPTESVGFISTKGAVGAR